MRPPSLLCTLALLALGSFGCSESFEWTVRVVPVHAEPTPSLLEDYLETSEIEPAISVPHVWEISVEEVLNAHDLPEPGPCNDLICTEVSSAFAPSYKHGEPRYWTRIAAAPGPPELWPLDLSIVVDRSEVMYVDMVETQDAAIGLVEELGPTDRVSVFAFNHEVDLVVEHGPPVVETATPVIRGLDAAGGWSGMPDALAAAVDLLGGLDPDAERYRRIVMLSCSLPEPEVHGWFEELAVSAGSLGIAFTFVGLLTPYDIGLDAILEETGGDYTTVESMAEFEGLLDQIGSATPSLIASDLRFQVELDRRLHIESGWGFPATPGRQSMTLTVDNWWVGERLEPIVMRLDGDEPEASLGELETRYTPDPGWGLGGHQSSSSAIGNQPGTDIYYENDGIRKVVALVNATEGLQEAAELYHFGEVAAARALLHDLIIYARQEAEMLDDDGLRREAEYLDRVRLAMWGQ